MKMIIHENCGTSQALCTFGALHSENCGTSQALCAPITKSYDRLRLFALSVHSTPENCGTSQALCTANAGILRQSQALCTPLATIAERLRLFAPRMMKFADSLRL